MVTLNEQEFLKETRAFAQDIPHKSTVHMQLIGIIIIAKAIIVAANMIVIALNRLQKTDK